MRREALETLKKVPFLAELESDPLEKVARRLRGRTVRHGEVLFHEGEPGRAAYFVHSGAVMMYQLSAGGRERIVHYERAGGFFNLVPILDGGTNPGTAEVVEDGLLFELRRADAEALMEECPMFTRALAALLAVRLRHLAYALGEQSSRQVRERLARLLVDLAEREGEKREDGILLPYFGQEELAALVGTVRECVSRALSEWRQLGLVRMEGRRIVVMDGRALADLAR